MSGRRLFPLVSYHRFDGVARRAFRRWFSVSRYWGGALWMVTVKHHQITFDFRRDWLADMSPKNGGAA